MSKKETQKKQGFQLGNTFGNRWQPGESGNPAGRPLKNLSIVSLVKEMLEQEGDNGKTNAELVAEAIIELAKKKDLPAIKELIERVDGKVAETHLIGNLLVATPDQLEMANDKQVEIKEEEIKLLGQKGDNGASSTPEITQEEELISETE